MEQKGKRERIAKDRLDKKKRAQTSSTKKTTSKVIAKKGKYRNYNKAVVKSKVKKYRKKQKIQSSKKRRKQQFKKIGLEIVGAALIASLVIWLFSFFIFAIVKVEGYAMLPNLDENEQVFVNKLKKPKRFQLIYIRTPDGKSNTIRRIIGLPNETLRYKEDQLWINNEMKPESFIEKEKATLNTEKPTYTEDFDLRELIGVDRIPKEKYVVLGDNRPYATDSRTYGVVDEKEIVGVVTTRLWPVHRIGDLGI
nr:signal peptidase I [Enterococcus sp. DIV0869a]